MIDSNFSLSTIRAERSCVYVPQSTYQYLELMKEHIHPSVAKGKGRSKEGFTVFNLYASATVTHAGAKHMHSIFMKPLMNKASILERQRTIEYLHSMSEERQKQLDHALKSIKNLRVIFEKSTNSRLEKDDWKRLCMTIEGIINIQELLLIGDTDSPALVSEVCDHESMVGIKEIFYSLKHVLDIKEVTVNKNVSE